MSKFVHHSKLLTRRSRQIKQQINSFFQHIYKKKLKNLKKNSNRIKALTHKNLFHNQLNF